MVLSIKLVPKKNNHRSRRTSGNSCPEPCTSHSSPEILLASNPKSVSFSQQLNAIIGGHEQGTHHNAPKRLLSSQKPCISWLSSMRHSKISATFICSKTLFRSSVICKYGKRSPLLRTPDFPVATESIIIIIRNATRLYLAQLELMKPDSFSSGPEKLQPVLSRSPRRLSPQKYS